MTDSDQTTDRRPAAWRPWQRYALAVAVLLLAGVLTALQGCDWEDGAALDPTSLPPVALTPQTGTDVTFFVAADTHFGHAGIAALNARQVQAMNALPGALWPGPAGGGSITAPRGVLIAGDLTDSGGEGEWDEFAKQYGLTGRDSPLKYPVFECTGNHDRHRLIYRPVIDRVKSRHGGSLLYSWNWDDVHVVCLDLYPDAAALRWLRRDLAAVDRAAPVVIFFHYSILGPFSEWWSDRERDAFAEAIQGYNVVALFHGHYHGSEHYTWRGYDVYNVGSPRHSTHSFAAVHITDDTLTVGSWNYDANDWDWSHQKRLGASVP